MPKAIPIGLAKTIRRETRALDGRLEADKGVWARAVRSEENAYYWKGEPIFFKASKAAQSKKPTIVELFSGCGGTSLGFEQAGFQVRLGADIHAPSVQTFRQNHPDASAFLGDLKALKGSAFMAALDGRSPDVMIAGVPCQGFSLNNRKRIADDPRNFLFLEFLRFVALAKPKIVMIENVSGMATSANGEFVIEIIKELKRLGYPHVETAMLNAADFGVPQLRKRLVYLASRVGPVKPPEPTHGNGNAQAYVTVWEALSDLPKLDPGIEKTKYRTAASNDYQRQMRVGEPGLTNHKAPSHPVETIEKIGRAKPGQPIYERFKQRIRLSFDMPSPTQVSGGIRPQFQFGHPEQPRGLSIRERCRLQSFPDSFVVSGGLVQGRVQTGNAVPPLLAKAVALAIRKRLGL